MKKRQIETEKLGGSKNKSDDMKQKVLEPTENKKMYNYRYFIQFFKFK